MLVTIHILLLFSFLIHASPLSGARGKYGSLKRKSWPYNSLITPSYVRRENSGNTNLDDAHLPDIKPSVTSSSSPSSTSNSPSSTSSSPSSGPSDSALNDESSDVDDGDEDEDEDEDDSIKDEDSSNDDHNTNIDDSVNNDKVPDNQEPKSGKETSNHDSLGVADMDAASPKDASSKDASSKDATSLKDVASSNDPSSNGVSKGTQSIIRASFTSNPKCGQTISCNAGKTNDHTGVHGIGAAAVNGMLFGGPPGVYDGSGGYTNIDGLGGACGSCWTLTPGYNYYESNGQSLGTTVVVRINDACTDPGYCDQAPGHPLNTGPTDGMQASGKFDAPVHFDLCEATGVAAAFFGEMKTGVAIGAARYNPDCVGPEDGAFGAKTVGKLAMSF